MENMNSMMSLFTVFIGLFTLYAAFTGKGPVFNNDYPKAMKADANAMLRKFCWYVGPVATLTGGLDYFWERIVGAEVVQNASFVWAQLPFVLSIALIVPGIVVYIVLFRKRFKQFLKKS